MVALLRSFLDSIRAANEAAFQREFGIAPSLLAGGDKERGREARQHVFAVLNERADKAWAAYELASTPGFTQEEKMCKKSQEEASDKAFKNYDAAFRAAQPFLNALRLREMSYQIWLGDYGKQLKSD